MKETTLTPEMIKTINFLGDQFNAEEASKREILSDEISEKEKEIEAQNEELRSFEKNEEKLKKDIKDLQDGLSKKDMEIEKLEFRVSEYKKEIKRLREITDGFLIKARETILEKREEKK
jgi:peptidoglycan hydrolase CwlO-like protein